MFGVAIDSLQQKTLDGLLAPTETISGEKKESDYAHIKGAQQFLQSVSKSGKTLDKVEGHISKVHTAVRGGNVGGLKSIIDKHIPKEGFFLVSGLETPNYKVPLPFGLDDIEVETSNLSMLECACVFNQKKVFKYLIEDMHICHSRDFSIKRGNQMISEQLFIFIPMIKKEWAMVTDLLQLSNLWTLKQLEDLMLLSK